MAGTLADQGLKRHLYSKFTNFAIKVDPSVVDASARMKADLAASL
jgi:hypothetical protein